MNVDVRLSSAEISLVLMALSDLLPTLPSEQAVVASSLMQRLEHAELEALHDLE